MCGWVIQLTLRLYSITLLLVIGGWVIGQIIDTPILAYQTVDTARGDIMTFDISRGLAVNLTRDPQARNANPAWSPDGRRIAFVSNHEQQSGLYIMDFDGRNRRMVLAMPGVGVPAWSPDGTTIAFHVTTVPNDHIYMMSLINGQPQQITTEITRGNLNPSWSPDGHFLVFMAINPDDAVANLYRLFTIRLDGRAIQMLPEPTVSGVPLSDAAAYNALDPAWSPDGCYIAHVAEGRIVILPVSVDDGDSWRITVPGGAYLRRPAWSPDSQWLAYHVAAPQTMLYISRIDGSDHRALVRGMQPAWRP